MDGSLKKDVMGSGDKHCCLIVDLEVGIWALGAWQIMYTVQTIFALIYTLCFFVYYKKIPMDYFIFTGIIVLCQVPSWVGAIYYFFFFIDKS